jgi:uncharacterized cupredoxin-like copper-binding protein
VSRRSRTWLLVVSIVAVLSLLSTIAVAAVLRLSDGSQALSLASCGPTRSQGSVVQVQLADSGGGGMMMGGSAMMVRVYASPTSVPSGEITFIATNTGALNHELLVLPAPADGPGTRAVGADGKIEESSRLGEASKSCGSGAGDGITPGARSWVTLHLKPGTYELLCDIPWHYANGMFEPISVR